MEIFGCNVSFPSCKIVLRSSLSKRVLARSGKYIYIFFRVLWPGGATFFYQKDGYADAGAAIYRSLQMEQR